MKQKAPASVCDTDGRGRRALAVDPQSESANLTRLKRIEGQVGGLQRMVEEDQYCPDILVQLSSVQEALRAVGQARMRNHLKHCVTLAVRKGRKADAEAKYDELIELTYTHAR